MRLLHFTAIAFLATGSVTVFPASVSAQTVVSETMKTELRFRHQRPSQFILALTETMPERRVQLWGVPDQVSPALYVAPILQRPATFLSGISHLTPDDTRKRLTVSGTKRAVTEIKKLASLFDVASKDIRVLVRVLRPNASEPSPSVVATATLEAENNKPNRVTLLIEGRPFRLIVTPHRNGDGSVFVAVELSADQANPRYSLSKVESAIEHIQQVKTQSVLLLPRYGDKGRRPPVVEADVNRDSLQFELSQMKP
jgi:hypothetical protein